MRGLEIVFLLLISLFLCLGCTGILYLLNSQAVEQAISDLATSFVDFIKQTALGVFYILIGVAIAVTVVGLGFAAKQGAESVGKAAILLMAAPAVKGAIENEQTARLPGGFTIERPQATPYQEFEQPQIEALTRTGHLLQRRRYGQNAEEERRPFSGFGEQSHQFDTRGDGSH